jgi:DNA repair exonuclease SbcCD ATPase subunit
MTGSSITITTAKRYSPLPKKSHLQKKKNMQQQEADVIDELRDELDEKKEMDGGTEVRGDGVADDDNNFTYGKLIKHVKSDVKLIKQKKKLIDEWEHKLDNLVDQKDINKYDVKKCKQMKKEAIQMRDVKYKKSLKIAQKALDDATTVSKMKRAKKALQHLRENRNNPSEEMEEARTMLERLKECRDKLSNEIKHAEEMLDRLEKEVDTLHEELTTLKKVGHEFLEDDMEKLNMEGVDKVNQYVELKKFTSPKHLNGEDEPNLLVEVKEALMALPVELLGSMNVPFLCGDDGCHDDDTWTATSLVTM